MSIDRIQRLHTNHPWYEAVRTVRAEIEELRADLENARANALRDALAELLSGPPLGHDRVSP
jgi:hypothetical protein